MNNLGKAGAICFVLWGLLHIIGSGAILLAVNETADAGFAIYQLSGSGYDQLAGSILGYFAFMLLWLAILVIVVAIRFNWNNNRTALALNSALVLMIEIGLIMFLLIPGYVGLFEAMPGFVLFVAAAMFGGIACTSAHANPNQHQFGG